VGVVDALMDTARADTELLYKLDAQGDDFSIPREVAFLLSAPSREKAELVRDFVNEHQYGVAKMLKTDGRLAVEIRVHMPIVQNVICSVSALMACLAALYGLDYEAGAASCRALPAAQGRAPRRRLAPRRPLGRGGADERSSG
jgi:hypothetical protein